MNVPGLVLLALLAAAPTPPPPCAGAVARDDGKPESGYGFVPSAIWGAYVGELRSSDLPSRQLREVCVCWLRTRGGDDVDFEVVFHADEGGKPAAEPYARVPARVTGVPTTKQTAGRLFPVDVGGVTVPEGRSWLGVRWDPSKSRFAFVCTDQGPETPFVPAFFAEDRAPRWTSVETAQDPVFKPHRALVLRATAWKPGEAPPPRPAPLAPAASATPRLGAAGG